MSLCYRPPLVLGGIVASAVSLTAAGGVGEPCPSSWDPFIGSPGFDLPVSDLHVLDGVLYAGGQFTTSGATALNHVAYWDGSSWQPVGDGFDGTVTELGEYQGELVASGNFFNSGDTFLARIAKWDGTAWGPMLPGVSASVSVFLEYDGKLLAGGGVTNPFTRLGAWDGTAWSTFAGGAGNGTIRTMIEFEGDLIVGGSFTQIGGMNANRIARWDGESWQTLGPGPGGMDDGVRDVVVYNGELIAAGDFDFPVDSIARWDGANWQPLGDGAAFSGGPIWALTVYEGNLIASGEFQTIDGVEVYRIARWDGTEWHPMGDACPGTPNDGCGMSGGVLNFADIDGGLVVGGHFTTAMGESVGRIVTWSGCTEPKTTPGDLNDDGVVDVSDLLILLGSWGECPRSCDADLDGNGTVDVSDLLELLANWG